MAEIRIQEKKKPIWPWILLILIIIAAAVLIYMYLDRNDYNGNNENVPADTSGYYNGDTLNQDGAYREAPGDDIDQFHAYTTQDTLGTFNKDYIINGLSLLAGAVYNIVNLEGTTRNRVNTKTDSLMSYTQNLSDTAGRNFSRDVSKSFSSAYDIISTVQQEKYPDLSSEVKELQSALKSFDSSKPVEAQERPVRKFFQLSASILSNMKDTARAI